MPETTKLILLKSILSFSTKVITYIFYLFIHKYTYKGIQSAALSLVMMQVGIW